MLKTSHLMLQQANQHRWRQPRLIHWNQDWRQHQPCQQNPRMELKQTPNRTKVDPGHITNEICTNTVLFIIHLYWNLDCFFLLVTVNWHKACRIHCYMNILWTVRYVLWWNTAQSSWILQEFKRCVWTVCIHEWYFFMFTLDIKLSNEQTLKRCRNEFRDFHFWMPTLWGEMPTLWGDAHFVVPLLFRATMLYRDVGRQGHRSKVKVTGANMLPKWRILSNSQTASSMDLVYTWQGNKRWFERWCLLMLKVTRTEFQKFLYTDLHIWQVWPWSEDNTYWRSYIKGQGHRSRNTKLHVSWGRHILMGKVIGEMSRSHNLLRGDFVRFMVPFMISLTCSFLFCFWRVQPQEAQCYAGQAVGLKDLTGHAQVSIDVHTSVTMLPS